MPVRFLSDAELARLSGWPHDVADDDLVTFFTLTSDDLGWLGSNVRVENRLGAAIQLCTLPRLGWIPDDLSGCPAAAVDRATHRLGAPADRIDRLRRDAALAQPPGTTATAGAGATDGDQAEPCPAARLDPHRDTVGCVDRFRRHASADPSACRTKQSGVAGTVPCSRAVRTARTVERRYRPG